MKSNYTLKKMRINLQTQDMWDSTNNGDDVDNHKDKMTIVVIYQVISVDVLLMLAEKDSTNAT